MLSYADRRCFLAQARAELLKWSGERTGPTLTSLPLAGSLHAEEVLSGKKRVGLYFSAHWCPPSRAN